MFPCAVSQLTHLPQGVAIPPSFPVDWFCQFYLLFSLWLLLLNRMSVTSTHVAAESVVHSFFFSVLQVATLKLAMHYRFTLFPNNRDLDYVQILANIDAAAIKILVDFVFGGHICQSSVCTHECNFWIE